MPTHTATAIQQRDVYLTQTEQAWVIAEATITSLGTICGPVTENYESRISPNGQWIATLCRGIGNNNDSYLRVVNILGRQHWDVHYYDYAKGTDYFSGDLVRPFYWSRDGKYLFAGAWSRADGCCWIGSAMFVMRLNLEDGQQAEIANYIDKDWIGFDYSISPSERFILIIPQDNPDHPLSIFDLYTWKQIEVEIKYGSTAGAGYTRMSSDDKKIILMLREYPEERQGDLTYGSLVLIDLETGAQNKLLSGLEYENTPIPIEWIDADHVLLYLDGEYLSLNINTAEMTKIEPTAPSTTSP